MMTARPRSTSSLREDSKLTLAYSTRPQLPNELLHKILLWSVADCLHILCTTTKCPWEMNMLLTFHCVSPSFRAISREIACKAFYMNASDASVGPSRFLTTSREILSYLHGTGKRLRHAAEGNSPHACVMKDEHVTQASPLLVSYTAYLNCTSLRTSAMKSSVAVYQKTQPIIISTLPRALSLCASVHPRHIATHLSMGIQFELGLARCGLVLVNGFSEISDQIASLRIFEDSIGRYGTGPISAVRSMIHRSLSRIEDVMAEYATIISPASSSQFSILISQLPGVLSTLRTACTIDLSDDDYQLAERLTAISHTLQ